MAKNNENLIDLPVTFVDLKADEQAPRFAAYQVDSAGRPVRKLGGYDGKALRMDLGDTRLVALGPDVEDFKTLPKESLANYRVAQNIDLWRKQGIVLPRDIWDRFHFHFACVTGTVRKCRPWFWDLIDHIRLTPMFELAQVARIKPITAELQPHILFPLRCQPLCDGIIEIYERECCCQHIRIPTLIDRLHDILDILPIPIPDPIPDPIPVPDPTPFTPQLLRTKARAIQRRKMPLDLTAVPPENLYQDYLALRTMPSDAARLYVIERPYLFPFFCHCSVRKVGQTPIQPGGQFDFCYLRIHNHPHHGHCFTTYAYKIKQLVNGVLTVVYDGLAAHQYFAAGGPADIQTFNTQARVCADGPGDPPPNDGAPFVMLEHVGGYGSFHFNFPAQTGVSQVGALGLDDGTYTTSYAPDCPWGGGLGLRLWFSPELEPIVKYYRLKVFPVNDTGSPVGQPIVLNSSVTWDKLVDIPGDVVRAPETLGPVPVGAENDLFKVPYWSSPDHRYLSGQFHQVWNTAQPLFPDGKYMLVIEVFDGAGNRIKPNGAAGPGTAHPFQFRRWSSTVDTDPVPYADAAHVFWIDNTPVGGDIVDLRKNGSINTAECQFMTDTAGSTFAIGFRAFHAHGVEHAGNGDDNSFMWHYDITWQRGLNGNTGTLGPAPSGGTNHTDVGETGGAVTSGSETFETMLTKTPPGLVLPKCTFSVTLRVYAKHYTGSSRIQSYDYHETASFALEIIS
ncbi:MAG: hypothetical protein IPP12_04040 [Nitrospira sp.]|nr:hypothetical protein [Nitrospira sp.]